MNQIPNAAERRRYPFGGVILTTVSALATAYLIALAVSESPSVKNIGPAAGGVLLTGIFGGLTWMASERPSDEEGQNT